MDIQNQTQQQIQIPRLEKQSTSYKLVVPKKVEEKIRYLINRHPHTEWSGILFYTFEGTFEDNNLLITCQDLYPMDIGTAGWTEFKITEDVAAYMAENIELINCETGLVHSHHSMGAFFSNQDIKTLNLEGNDTNCFVSLIVDTKGTYQAAITRKVHKTLEHTITLKEKSYEFFGNGKVDITDPKYKKNLSITKEIQNDTIEYFMLDVTRKEIDNNLKDLELRMLDIEKTKAQQSSKYSIPSFYDAYINTNNKDNFTNRNNLYNNSISRGPQSIINTINSVPSKVNIANSDSNNDNNNNNSSNVGNLVGSINNTSDLTVENTTKEYKVFKSSKYPQLKEAAVRLVMCSLIMSPATVDLKQWVHKYLMKVYTKIFETSESFASWKEFAVGYIIDRYTVDYSVEERNMFIESLVSMLAPYEKYSYVTSYIEELSLYYEDTITLYDDYAAPISSKDSDNLES